LLKRGNAENSWLLGVEGKLTAVCRPQKRKLRVRKAARGSKGGPETIIKGKVGGSGGLISRTGEGWRTNSFPAPRAKRRNSAQHKNGEMLRRGNGRKPAKKKTEKKTRRGREKNARTIRKEGEPRFSVRSNAPKMLLRRGGKEVVRSVGKGDNSIH